MHTAPLTGLLSALILAAFALTPAQDTPPARPKSDASAGRDVLDDMEGMWRLVEFKAKLLTTERRSEVGYLLVNGNYMSLEMHLGWSRDRQVEIRDFATGMHRLEIGTDGRVKTSSVIGTFIDTDSKIEFEAPGKTRSLEVAVVGTKMTMTRDDGQKYVFEKMTDSRERRDIYGRVIKEKPEEPKAPGGTKKE